MGLKSGLINFGGMTNTFNLGDVLLVGGIGRNPHEDIPKFNYTLYLRDFPVRINSKDYSTFEEAKQARDALVEAWVEYIENKEEGIQCRK